MSGDNKYGQMGNGTNESTNYLTLMGYKYLDYEDKEIEVNSDGYTIDKNKLKYLCETINVYNKEEKDLEVGQLEYEPMDTSLIKVSENGHITPLKEEGTTELKIKDVTNGYYTTIKVIVNNKRIQDTDTVLYIYNIDDLVKFRDSVNAGNDYAGKTVYVMADIDMSPACSEESGVSWEPIGATGTVFAGTFDGNYHTLSNLYNNSNAYRYVGLFAQSNGAIQNLILENVYIHNNYSSSTMVGGIVSRNTGKIINCGVESGNLLVTTTTYSYIGGICGANQIGTIVSSINNCYNKASISATLTSGDYIRAGGICGELLHGSISNCYNSGSITSSGKNRTQNGGIVGAMYNTRIENCYNTGKISGIANRTEIGGIVGNNGEAPAYPAGTINNSYCTTSSCGIAYYYYSGGMKTTTSGRIEESTLKSIC